MPPDVVRAWAIFVGINVVAFVLVTYALVRQTFWWVVAGVLSGACIFSLWVMVVLAVYKGLRTASERRQTAASARSVEALSAHQITGTKLPYKIVVPAGWKVLWGIPNLDTAMHDGSGLYAGVMVGKSVGTAIEAANQARERVKTKSTNVKISELTQVQIDGRTWLRFTAQWQREKPSLHEIHEQRDVYSGPEGLFEVIGWRSEAFHPRDEEIVSELAAGCRFPGSQHTPSTFLNFQVVEPSPPFGDLKTAP